MTIKYQIECYDKKCKKYRKVWEGHDFSWAEKMINKPYYQRNTRRLKRITTEILRKLPARRQCGIF